ncbi:MAG: M24 family metallopeptidase [Chloroflexi bacterium]|nr:M24 family metallopeptidase [Chloroflexota bacterium]
MIDLQRAQAYMRENDIQGWLICDFRGGNPVLWHVLGQKKWTTRRCFLWVPPAGEPRALVHVVDRNQFAGMDLAVELYVSWPEMQGKLQKLVAGQARVAVEYSPGGAIPVMSWVDGGTLDLLRGLGMEVCSSADLFQVAAATWSPASLDSHLRACSEVAAVKDAAFAHIRRAVAGGRRLSEYDVQEVVLQDLLARGLEVEGRPIVGVNHNSANPHYEPTAEVHQPIGPGDWVLLDLWARVPGDEGVFADMTWVAFVGPEVPEKQKTVFEVVRRARDAVVERLQLAWAHGEVLQGWQLDQVARQIIAAAGYGEYFVHRTGHSMGPGPSTHGLGVNLDDLETHDTRWVVPGVGFSVEPGIYLEEFGVRSEINVFMHPDKGPLVTTPLQEEIVRLG